MFTALLSFLKVYFSLLHAFSARGEVLYQALCCLMGSRKLGDPHWASQTHTSISCIKNFNNYVYT